MGRDARVRAPGGQSLFGSDQIVDRCWCMWYFVRVEDFHAAGRDGNRAAFKELMANADEPLGVIAHQDGEPVGWCAVGPRTRYTRLLKTPTLRDRDRNEDDAVWIVPCFFVSDGSRRGGVSAALLRAAVALAQENGAKAIEGFPDPPKKRSERGARGSEATFDACGFTAVSRPSAARVIMRRAF